MKERIKRYLERNKWIYLWVVISILFAIIVQWLFSKPASSEIFHAKWGAGDILTYASTVALGLLAVWQNQKFKEENDKSQERLEKLTRQANELAIIGKIIDNRSAKLQRLQKCFSEFELVSSVGDISTMSIGVKDFDELQSHLTERTLDLISKSQVLIIEIFGNTGIGCKKIYQSISRLQSATQKIIDYYYAGALEPINPNMLDEYIEAHQEFVTEQAHYLIKTEEILNAISYEDVSLADIRDFINSTSKKQEDSPNEQQTSPSDPQPDHPEH